MTLGQNYKNIYIYNIDNPPPKKKKKNRIQRVRVHIYVCLFVSISFAAKIQGPSMLGGKVARLTVLQHLQSLSYTDQQCNLLFCHLHSLRRHHDVGHSARKCLVLLLKNKNTNTDNKIVLIHFWNSCFYFRVWLLKIWMLLIFSSRL